MSDDGFRIPGESEAAPDEVPDAALAQTLGGGETEYVTGAEGKRPNKSAAIFGAAVLLGGAVLYGMYWRAGPSAAAAADPAAERTIQTFLKAGGRGASRDAEAMVEQFEQYPNAAQVPLDDLRTNPFRHQPPTAPEADAAAVAQTVAALEVGRAAALKAVRSLNVQSILHGTARRACLINGAFYREGERVDGFTVEQIRPDSVVVRSGPFRFEVMMRGE